MTREKIRDEISLSAISEKCSQVEVKEKNKDKTTWDVFNQLLDSTPRGNFGNIGMFTLNVDNRGLASYELLKNIFAKCALDKETQKILLRQSKLFSVYHIIRINIILILDGYCLTYLIY